MDLFFFFICIKLYERRHKMLTAVFFIYEAKRRVRQGKLSFPKKVTNWKWNKLNNLRRSEYSDFIILLLSYFNGRNKN